MNPTSTHAFYVKSMVMKKIYSFATAAMALVTHIVSGSIQFLQDYGSASFAEMTKDSKNTLARLEEPATHDDDARALAGGLTSPLLGPGFGNQFGTTST